MGTEFRLFGVSNPKQFVLQSNATYSNVVVISKYYLLTYFFNSNWIQSNTRLYDAMIVLVACNLCTSLVMN